MLLLLLLEPNKCLLLDLLMLLLSAASCTVPVLSMLLGYWCIQALLCRAVSQSHRTTIAEL